MQATKVSFALILLTLMFWGWQTDRFWLGLLLAGILMGVFLLKGRYRFDKASFFQIADLCALIAFAIFAFLWIDDKASKAVYPTLALLPVALLPLLMFQLLDEKQQVPFSALMFLKRKLATSWFDFVPVYIGICLFAAATAKPEPYSYYAGMVLLLLALFLLLHRQQNLMRQLQVVLMFAVAAGLGLGLQWQLVDLQKQIEGNINQWLLNRHNTSHTATAIGDVGRLKLSDEIILRVKPLSGKINPMLLREGSYLRYFKGSWFGGAWTDKSVPLEAESWRLHESEVAFRYAFRMFRSFPESKATLALPARTARIEGLPAEDVTIRQGASVQVDGVPPFAAFEVVFGGRRDASILQPSSVGDLWMPKTEAQVIAKVAADLNLYQLRYEQGDKAVLNELKRYFFREHSYSTYLVGTKGQQHSLSHFLLQSKSGHCEYFATATVLLLREVGIPARYAVGYSMQEWDADAGMFLVRGRDAHAWAEAEVDGIWQEVDNTPPNWFEFENQNRSSLQGLKDLWSELVFIFKQWRYAESEIQNSVWYTLLALLFVVLAWRVLRQVNVEEQLHKKAKGSVAITSNWLLLEQELEKAGFSRLPGESLTTWLKRIKMDELLPFVPLYYQQRFDKTPDPQQQQTLDAMIEDFRKRFADEQAMKK